MRVAAGERFVRALGLGDPVAGVGGVDVAAVAIVGHRRVADDVDAGQPRALQLRVRGDAGVEHGHRHRCAAGGPRPRALHTGHAAQARLDRMGVAAARRLQPPLAAGARKERIARRRALQQHLAIVGLGPGHLGQGAQARQHGLGLGRRQRAAELQHMRGTALRPQRRRALRRRRAGQAGRGHHPLHTLALHGRGVGPGALNGHVARRLGMWRRVLQLDDQAARRRLCGGGQPQGHTAARAGRATPGCVPARHTGSAARVIGVVDAGATRSRPRPVRAAATRASRRHRRAGDETSQWMNRRRARPQSFSVAKSIGAALAAWTPQMGGRAHARDPGSRWRCYERARARGLPIGGAGAVPPRRRPTRAARATTGRRRHRRSSGAGPSPARRPSPPGPPTTCRRRCR